MLQLGQRLWHPNIQTILAVKTRISPWHRPAPPAVPSCCVAAAHAPAGRHSELPADGASNWQGRKPKTPPAPGQPEHLRCHTAATTPRRRARPAPQRRPLRHPPPPAASAVPAPAAPGPGPQ